MAYIEHDEHDGNWKLISDLIIPGLKRWRVHWDQMRCQQFSWPSWKRRRVSTADAMGQACICDEHDLRWINVKELNTTPKWYLTQLPSLISQVKGLARVQRCKRAQQHSSTSVLFLPQEIPERPGRVGKATEGNAARSRGLLATRFEIKASKTLGWLQLTVVGQPSILLGTVHLRSSSVREPIFGGQQVNSYLRLALGDAWELVSWLNQSKAEGPWNSFSDPLDPYPINWFWCYYSDRWSRGQGVGYASF